MVPIDLNLVSAVTTVTEILEIPVTAGATAVTTLQEVVTVGIAALEVALLEVVMMAGVMFPATLVTHGGE